MNSSSETPLGQEPLKDSAVMYSDDMQTIQEIQELQEMQELNMPITTLNSAYVNSDMATELERLIQINTAKRARSLTLLAVTMCVLSAVFYCYEYYLRVAPSVMKAELMSAFHLSDAAFGNLFACYYYAYTPMQIPVGMMLDRFGPRRILTFACFLCAAGTYLFSITNMLSLAQLARFIIGFGSAFAYVGVLKISDCWLPKKYFALMVGIATTLGMVGAMTGELTMAYMVEKMGWQSTLFWSVLSGILLTILLAVILKDTQDANLKEGDIKRIDIKHNNIKHNDIKNKDIKHSKQTAHTPYAEDNLTTECSTSMHNLFMGLLKIMATPQMWINGLIGCLMFLPITVFAELWAVPYLQTLGFSRADAAFGSSMVFLGFALGGPCWGYVSDKIQSRKLPLIVGSFLSSLFLFACIFLTTPSAFWIYTLLFLCSFAASVQVLVFAIGNDITESSVTATAVAFTNMLVMLGGALLPQIIGKILDFTLLMKEGVMVPGTENYGAALVIIPIGLLLAGLLSLCLRESYKQHR